MWTSDALHGPDANWRHLGALFTTSLDVLPSAHLRKEFTTSNFFGGIPGDPLDGRTRVITNGGAAEDGGSTEYYIGTQEPGSKFVLGRGEHAVGMIDWGSFVAVDGSSRGLAGLRGTHSRGQSMCRTLGGDANQVAVKGRRVMVCWMGGPGGAEPRHSGWPTQALQSLSREISLSSESELLQQFVPRGVSAKAIAVSMAELANLEHGSKRAVALGRIACAKWSAGRCGQADVPTNVTAMHTCGRLARSENWR